MILIKHNTTTNDNDTTTTTTTTTTNVNNNNNDICNMYFTVGNPHRAQMSQFELFVILLLLKVIKPFSIEQFEATGSQSTVHSPPLEGTDGDGGRRCRLASTGTGRGTDMNTLLVSNSAPTWSSRCCLTACHF